MNNMIYGYPASTATGTVQDYRYSFDPVTGNLNSRQNFKRSLSETFLYDNLDRLTTVTGPQNLSMTYNANGNITTKSDIGTTAFGYGTGAGPYALTSVTSSATAIPAVAQTITYTSFESVATIAEGNYIATIIYNIDNQRAKMDVTQSGTNILTRYYAGSSYMKETAAGITKEYTYLGGDAYHAPVVAVTQSGATTYYYLLRDYLGNITHVYNASTSTVAEYGFDAWGRRRNPISWSYDLTSQPELFAGRGFTSHEHLPWFNLVNMNGRLYDPAVGRFISPDPYVQMPDQTQNMNRYTYCMNNPLLYVDYNGYTWLSNFGDWLGDSGKAIVSTVVTVGVVVGVTAICVGTGGLGAVAIAAIAGASGGIVGGALNTAFAGGSGNDFLVNMAIGAGVGGISGVVGGAAGSWASKHIGGIILNGFTISAKSAIGGFVTGAIGGMAGGYAGGFTGGLILSGGNLTAAMKAGINGLKMGGAIGGAVGGVQGYRAAGVNCNKWTGAPDNSIVIGRNMVRRVNPTANDIGSESISKEWGEAVLKGELNELDRQAGENWNRNWINTKMDQNYTIFDIGDGGFGTEGNYGMELNVSSGYNNIFQLYKTFNNLNIYHYGK